MAGIFYISERKSAHAENAETRRERQGKSNVINCIIEVEIGWGKSGRIFTTICVHVING